MKRSFVLAAAILVVAGACGGAETAQGPAETSPRANPLPRARDGNFVLYVSNQSFELPRVDVRIEIDGRAAVDDRFDVGNQHNWVEFRFRLQKGRHTIRAMSTTGEAEGSWQFTVTGQHWAVMDYWYYPGDSKRFSFDLSNEPIGLA